MLTEQVCKMLAPGNGLPCRHYIRPNEPGEPGFCTQGANFFCTEAMKKYLPSISYSTFSDFVQCRRKHYLHVVCGLKVRAEHLPEPVKLGCDWDSIIRGKYEPAFDPCKEIIPLRLSPEQVAKINALNRALRDLEVHINKEGLLGCQYKVTTQILNTNLVGFVDRAYEDLIVESKLSTRPEFYLQKENVAYQLGTYFLCNEAWEYAVVEIARVPSLKMKDGEENEAYEERIYGDIISRPAHYFLGWDRKTRTYGTRFWRSEFDLEEIYSTYCYVLHEIRETVERGAWYQNNLACHVPTPCPYLPIKRSGVVSEEIFEKRHMRGGEPK
jgi:hypothetical protein